jgi:hypothetical protein
MENQNVQQDQFDRFTSLQHESEYTIEGNVSGKFLDCGIIVKPDLITSLGLQELQKEFTVLITDDGLILED